MSCDDINYSPRGRQGIGVIQPQSGLDYPFVSPSDDVRFLFADFFFSYDDPADYGLTGSPYALPFRVSWVYGIGCDIYESQDSLPANHAADLIIVDANDRVVFDSTEAQEFIARDWGADYKIYEWKAKNTPSVPVGGVCRAVVYKTWPESFEISAQQYPEYFTPENAVLDGRATYRLPKRVLSLTVRAGTQTLGNITEVPSVALLEGYNMQITAGETSLTEQLRNTEITFAAIPGAGIGKYSDCDQTPTPPILNINGANPNQYGDFLMKATGCSYIRVPTQRVGDAVRPIADNCSAMLLVGDDCPPCCDCQDYVNLAQYMNRLQARYKLIADRAQETRELYVNNRDRWQTHYDCRMSKPLTLILVPQYCPMLDVVMMLCNHCDDCLQNVRLTTNFATTPGGGSATIVCGHTEIRGPRVQPGSRTTVGGAWPEFYVDLPPLDKGETSYVKFRLKFDSRFPFAVSGTLTGTHSRDSIPIMAGCDSQEPAESFAQETLNCDKFGNNSQPC
jgi:hypothetical protein